MVTRRRPVTWPRSSPNEGKDSQAAVPWGWGGHLGQHRLCRGRGDPHCHPTAGDAHTHLLRSPVTETPAGRRLLRAFSQVQPLEGRRQAWGTRGAGHWPLAFGATERSLRGSAVVGTLGLQLGGYLWALGLLRDPRLRLSPLYNMGALDKGFSQVRVSGPRPGPEFPQACAQRRTEGKAPQRQRWPFASPSSFPVSTRQLRWEGSQSDNSNHGLGGSAALRAGLWVPWALQFAWVSLRAPVIPGSVVVFVYCAC